MKDIAVIITGASSGIGRALAVKCINAGAKVSICGRSNERLAPLVALAPDRVFASAFCLSSEETIVRFVKDSNDSFGAVNILVNCAGVNSARAPISAMKTEDLDWMHTINVRAPMVFMREASQTMFARRSGTVVNIISSVALFANEGIAAYTASKRSLAGLTDVFRKEAREHNVAVCAVYPGGVNSAFRPAHNPHYMSADTVAEAVFRMITLGNDALVDELVLRPMVERNFV